MRRWYPTRFVEAVRHPCLLRKREVTVATEYDDAPLTVLAHKNLHLTNTARHPPSMRVGIVDYRRPIQEKSRLSFQTENLSAGIPNLIAGHGDLLGRLPMVTGGF